MQESCESCRFWRQIEPGNEGECRYSPPAITVEGRGVWPITTEEKWCGNYEEGFDT